MRSAPRSSSRALPAPALHAASSGPYAFAGHELARGAPRLEFPGRGKRGGCGIRCEARAPRLSLCTLTGWCPLLSDRIGTFSGTVLLAALPEPTQKR